MNTICFENSLSDLSSSDGTTPFPILNRGRKLEPLQGFTPVELIFRPSAPIPPSPRPSGDNNNNCNNMYPLMAKRKPSLTPQPSTAEIPSSTLKRLGSLFSNVSFSHPLYFQKLQLQGKTTLTSRNSAFPNSTTGSISQSSSSPPPHHSLNSGGNGSSNSLPLFSEPATTITSPGKTKSPKLPSSTLPAPQITSTSLPSSTPSFLNQQPIVRSSSRAGNKFEKSPIASASNNTPTLQTNAYNFSKNIKSSYTVSESFESKNIKNEDMHMMDDTTINPTCKNDISMPNIISTSASSSSINCNIPLKESPVIQSSSTSSSPALSYFKVHKLTNVNHQYFQTRLISPIAIRLNADVVRTLENMSCENVEDSSLDRNLHSQFVSCFD
jgi:hypothetical protein